jgi:hypothetical protein
MAWSAVIQNIVTEADLSTELSNYYTSAQVDASLTTKLNQNGGTANNLKLTGIGTDPTSAISKADLDSASATLTTAINQKASLGGATFTGPVVVPTATVGGHAVRLDQLGVYLEKTGGTITGPITYASAPSTGAHLANKTYVDGVVALKSDITYVDSELATKADATDLALKMDVDGGTFTGYVQLLEPTDPQDNSALAATTAFVNQRIATLITGKADTNAPTINNPTFTGAVVAPTPITGNNTTTVATTAFVQNELSVLGATKANITSPTLSGTPSTPTPAPLDNSTQIANTEFVNLFVSGKFVSPAFSGTPTSTLPPLADDSSRIATTAWVRDLLTDLGVIV